MEKKEKLDIASFSPHLFWDAKAEDIDFEEHAPYVIQRVLEYGSFEDWKQILSYYGKTRIGEIAIRFRSLEPTALAFVSIITHQPKEKFRCYILKQSNQQPWFY